MGSKSMSVCARRPRDSSSQLEPRVEHILQKLMADVWAQGMQVERSALSGCGDLRGCID